MSKTVRLLIEPAVNGGLVFVTMGSGQEKVGEVAAWPKYLCPSLKPEAIGSVVLSIMAANALKANEFDGDIEIDL